MPDEVKLLPCPFCGAGAAIGGIASKPPRYFVNCVMCEAVLGDTIGYSTQDEAIAAWNTRPPIGIDEVVERVARAICGRELDYVDCEKACLAANKCVGNLSESVIADARAAIAAMKDAASD